MGKNIFGLMSFAAKDSLPLPHVVVNGHNGKKYQEWVKNLLTAD